MSLKLYPKTKLTMGFLRNFLLVSLVLVLSLNNSSAQNPATAFNFNGTNTWYSVPVSPSLNISRAITIELWIKPTKAFGTQDVISKSSNIVSNGYNFPRFLPNLDSLQFLLNINGFGWQTLSVYYGASKLNQWHHVTATYDGIIMSIYIDGVLAGTKSFAGTITVNNNPLSIGIQNGFTRYFGGSVDDIRIWSRSLSQCEIANSMSCELAGTEDGLALYHKLNQGITNQANPTITTVTDATINNNTGNLQGTFSSSWIDGTVVGNCIAFAGPTASAVQSLVPVGGTIQLLGTGTGTFSWTGPNGFISNQQNPVLIGVSPLASGTYTLTVTNNGCSAITRTTVTVAWAAGALNFNSLGNKVVVPNNASLNIASTITIETWINPSNTLPSVQNVVSKSSSNVTASPGGYIFPRTEDGWRNFMFRIFINGTWRVVSAPYTSLNQWNHVAATYDGAVMKIYLNGTLAGSLAMSGSITYNPDDLTIGVQNGTTEYFQGGVDETRIWSRALTQCEIQNNISCELYGAGPGGLAAQNGLAAYFRYNQGLVNVNNTGYTTLADSSVNGNNGILQGFFLNGLTSNWITGNVNATCSPYVGTQATAGSNGPNIALGSTLNLTSSTGNSWLWTGPNGFSSTLQNPSISNVTGSNSGAYTVTIAGGGCNSSASTNVTVSTRAGTLSFDGDNDFVSVPSNQSLKGNKTITIESWIYPTNNTDLVQDVISKSTTTTVNSGYIFPRTDDGWRTFSFYMQVGSTYQILSAPYAGSINQWHHVAATYDGFYMRLYLDGALAASKEASGDILTNDEPITIGTQPGYPEFFYGQVDETRIWNRPLTQCELINNMNCELAPTQKNGLALYFKYNQGFLNADNTGVNTLIDASDNLNNGTLNNFALTGATSNWADVKVGGTCSVFIEPPVTATANASIYAVGSTIQLFGTGGYTGLGGNAYIWDGPNAFHVTTQNPVISNAQSNASGTYTLTAPFVNCIIQKSLKLSVSSLSLITANGPTTFCPSLSVTLSSSTTGSAYQWYRNAVLMPGATANTYVATQTGDYTVSITSANGIDILLSAPVTVTVVDNSAPVPNQLALPALNLFTPATVTSIPTASDDCRGTITGTTSDPVTYNTPGTYTIRWTYDDLNGHVVTQNQQVIVVLGVDLIPPVLTVPSTINLSANVTDCGAIANFTATATDNSLLPVTITYSKNPGTIFPAGTTTVTVTATDASLNVTTKTFNVIVAPTTVAAITGTTSICAGITTALASATTGGVWSSDNTAVASVNASGIVTGVTAGTANIKYTNNCGVFASAAITIKAVPVTPVVTVTDNCGSSVLSTNASGSLLWSTGSSSSSITVSTAGSYTVTAGSNGCTSPAGSGTAAPKTVPTAPVVTVTNNCGSTTLSTNAGGSLSWSTTGETTSSITVSNAGSYSVTQTVNGCISAPGSGLAAPKAIPSAPVVTVADNCGTSVLSTNAAGTIFWSTGAATSSITVSTAGSYSVTQTVNGCVSASGSGVAAPKASPSAPIVTVTDNCGSSVLTTNAAGTLLWSIGGATTSSIAVSTAGSYSVTQTVNGCVSAAGSGVAAPKAVPSTPIVTVTDNCGSSVLTTNAAGTLLWSTGSATAASITVSTAGSYTVTQSVNGCVSAAGSGVANPKVIPSAPLVNVADNCGTSVLSTNAAGTLLWSTAAATSSISVSTAGSYSVTQTVNGCVSASGSGVAAPKAVPATPVITVSNNCGSTTLSTTANGNILWSNNATTPSIIITAGGNYSVTVTNGALCSATSAVTAVTVNVNPVVAAISGNTTVSIGTTTQLANATSGGVWSSNSANASVTASGLVTGVTGGTATISYTVTGAGGCATTVSTIVTVITCTTPVFTVSPANISVNTFETGCTVPVNYTATASGSPAYTYTFTGATIASGSGTGSGYLFNKGTTTVLVRATNGCGSATITPFSVIVNGFAAPIIIAANQDAFCNKLTLNGSVSSVLNPTYRWVNGNNTTYASGSQISLDQNSNDGIYQLYVTANGCTVAAAPYNYQKQNLVSSYTLLAKSLIDLGSNNIVASGSVGVINNGGEVEFSSYSSVASPGSFVKASKIDRDGSNINLLNPIYSPATGIVLPTMYYDNQSTSGLSSLTVSQNSSSVNGNYKNLTIKKGVSATVNGNNFGTIRIEQGAQVTFTSPMIYVDVLQVVKGPRIGYSYIRFSNDTKVVVSSSVFIGSQVFVNPDNKKVTFYVGGNNNGNDKHGDDKNDKDKNNKGNNDFMVKGGDTKVNANIFIPDGTLNVTGGYRYGDYGGGYGDCDKDDDEDKYYGQGNVNVYMTGLFIADEIDGNGKNIIWNSFDCSAAPVPVVAYTASTVIGLSQSVTQEKATTTVSSEEVLKVTVMPNPSTTFFTLKFESKYEAPVNMRVMDANGRVVDAQSKIGSNSTIQIGVNYASGTYYAEMIQGTTRKVVQLIKVRG